MLQVIRLAGFPDLAVAIERSGGVQVMHQMIVLEHQHRGQPPFLAHAHQRGGVRVLVLAAGMRVVRQHHEHQAHQEEGEVSGDQPQHQHVVRHQHNQDTEDGAGHHDLADNFRYLHVRQQFRVAQELVQIEVRPQAPQRHGPQAAGHPVIRIVLRVVGEAVVAHVQQAEQLALAEWYGHEGGGGQNEIVVFGLLSSSPVNALMGRGEQGVARDAVDHHAQPQGPDAHGDHDPGQGDGCQRANQNGQGGPRKFR